MKVLVFDTETTDMVRWKLPPEHESQPDLVQLGMLLVETAGWSVKARLAALVRLPEGVRIEPEARRAHGISEQDCSTYGAAPVVVCSLFNQFCMQAEAIVAHNMSFDRSVMLTALHRIGRKPNRMADKRILCTKELSTDLLKLPGKYGGYKWPTLAEAYRFFTGEDVEGAHDAMVDTEACLVVFRGLCEAGVVEL